jgi:hypothetical protein
MASLTSMADIRHAEVMGRRIAAQVESSPIAAPFEVQADRIEPAQAAGILTYLERYRQSFKAEEYNLIELRCNGMAAADITRLSGYPVVHVNRTVRFGLEKLARMVTRDVHKRATHADVDDESAEV